MKLNRICMPLLALVLVSGSVAAAAAPAPEPADFSKLVTAHAPTLVSIKFILKTESEQEEEETTGVMIDAAGLVLTSNASFGGMFARFGGPTPTPTDIKVLVGDDTQGVAAKIVARDSELGLAWVQVDTAPASPYAFVDFSKGVEPVLGENIYMVSLMGKFFDRAPAVAEGRLGAVVSKPRRLYIPSIGLAGGELGMPIFNAEGKAVGVSTLILPEQEEMDGSGNMRSALRGITGGMILPASEVVEATSRAREIAASGAGEPAAEPKPADAPAEAPK